MATRQETQERRAALVRDVLEAQRASGWDGGAAPSQRILGARYGLSLRTVSLELRKLADDGLLDVKPRVGTFSSGSGGRAGQARAFAVVLPYALSENVQLAMAHYGFESRVAERGAACLSASFDALSERVASGDWELAGAFAFDAARLPESALTMATLAGGNVVTYDPDDAPAQAGGAHDRVGIDNFDGGRVAARRLLESGHRRIAFLGLHRADEAGLLTWSRAREDGWRQALREASIETKRLAFTPAKSLGAYDQGKRGRSGALKLLPRLRAGEISAVVTANAIATNAMLEVLRDARLDASRWPSIVSFDDAPPAGDAPVVSALRLPWEAIGREAADLLWERATGRLSGPPVCRLAKMTLIPRLTCGPKL